jgi:excinuclease UvrABC helicase subunit UvrB
MRTEYDLEMMDRMGFCSGIEKYSGIWRVARPVSALHSVRFFS